MWFDASVRIGQGERVGHGEETFVAAVTDLSSADRGGRGAPRRIKRQQPLPGVRAVVGGLLMAVAAIGTFASIMGGDDGPSDEVVVARRPIRVGETIEASHLRLARAELPDGTADLTFDDASRLVGRVALGPIGEDEVIQGASVTADRARPSTHEVAITLPRGQIAVGRLRQGERVDVYATDDERTWSVVRRAEVVEIDAGSDGSLTSERELSVVVAVSSPDEVAAVVHALRRADVTVVRATFAGDDGGSVEHDPVAEGPTTAGAAGS